jgi:hypothetical protein
MVHAELNPAKATQLPLSLLHKALELQGIEKDNGELRYSQLQLRRGNVALITLRPLTSSVTCTDVLPSLIH